MISILYRGTKKNMLANCWGFRWYANLFGWWKKSLKMNYYRHCCFTSINLDFYQNHWHVIWREYWQPSKGEIRPNTTGHTHIYIKAQTHRYTRKMCIYSLNILSENYLSQINRGKNLFHGKTWKMPYCKYLRDGIYIENLFFHAFFFLWIHIHSSDDLLQKRVFLFVQTYRTQI